MGFPSRLRTVNKHGLGVVQPVVPRGAKGDIARAIHDESVGRQDSVAHPGGFLVSDRNRHVAKAGPLDQAVGAEELVARERPLGHDRVQRAEDLPGVLDHPVFSTEPLRPAAVAARPQLHRLRGRGPLEVDPLHGKCHLAQAVTQALVRRVAQGYPLTVAQNARLDFHLPRNLRRRFQNVRSILHDAGLPLRHGHLRDMVVLEDDVLTAIGFRLGEMHEQRAVPIERLAQLPAVGDGELVPAELPHHRRERPQVDAILDRVLPVQVRPELRQRHLGKQDVVGHLLLIARADAVALVGHATARNRCRPEGRAGSRCPAANRPGG